MPDPILTVSAAAERIQRGETTASALLEDCLERIGRFEEGVRAWVLVDEKGARRDAAQLDAELAGGQPPRSPLHGVPVGVKDIFDVQGFPTRCGSPITSDAPAAVDAPLVARLRRAGAVIVGKTVTTEFASFDPSPTRNPWNPAHTPGGSSSGSAAAVAAGMCLAALGSQTGGSITRPASYCGVSGLKPTFGALCVEGIMPLAFHMDHPGPIARTVGDLNILWQILSDGEPSDCAAEQSISPPRLGIVGDYFDAHADAAVRAATRDAVERLASAGAKTSPQSLPARFLEVQSNHRRIMAVEAAEYHRASYAAHKERYGASISALIEEGLVVAAIDYAAALKYQIEFRREMGDILEDCDALVTPATLTPAPASLASTGDPAFNTPWSLTGLPTVSLPCGLSPEGMPCSLQLIGAWGKEEKLLQVAAWCEKALNFQALPSILAG